jgi:hypothetical protein
MRQRKISISIVMISFILLAACGPDESVSTTQAAEGTAIHQASHRNWPDAPQLVTSESLPCEQQMTSNQLSCDVQERQILATVVRYEIYGPSKDGSSRQAEGLGHGTVKDGRYLVVHNHFGVNLASFESSSKDAVITMYNGVGDLFMWRSSPQFTVAVEEPEALVLDFGISGDGEGFFESLGIPSASFDSRLEAVPRAGQIVAQVIWDGRFSDVTWTKIDEVTQDDGTPSLVLANPLFPGASGGGVFLAGTHIAVNWQRGRHLDGDGTVIGEFSTAALNSSALVDIG